MLRANDEVRDVFVDAPVKPIILDKGKYDLTTLWTILRLIRREKIHVMHLHCYAASIFGRLASMLSGVPAVIHDYDTAVYFPYPRYLWAADRLLAPFTRRAAAASPMVRDYFVKRRAVPSDKVSLLLHAIPQEKFRQIPQQKIDAARQRLNIDKNARVLGTVTKLGPERGNKYFLRAAAEVIKQLPNTIFTIVYKSTIYHRRPDSTYVDLSRSESENRIEDLDDTIRELGIANNVRLVEISDDVDELIANFDVFVAPFLSQRFSSVNLLEAMAQAKPVIATNIGESAEIIVNGRNGYLVPVDDENKFAQQLCQILSEPGKLERLGRGAASTAAQHSVDAFVQTLETWYAGLAGKDQAQTPKPVEIE